MRRKCEAYLSNIAIEIQGIQNNCSTEMESEVEWSYKQYAMEEGMLLLYQFHLY